MPLGSGRAPAGAHPAGYGVPDVAPVPNLTPLPDYRTGLSDGGRYIVQAVPGAAKGGDYAFTLDGRLVGMPNVYQLVLLAIDNLDFSALVEKGPNYKQQVSTILQNALANVVAQKLVQITSIVLTVGGPNVNPDATIATVYWRDLTTGQNGQPVPVTP